MVGIGGAMKTLLPTQGLCEKVHGDDCEECSTQRAVYQVRAALMRETADQLEQWGQLHQTEMARHVFGYAASELRALADILEAW